MYYLKKLFNLITKYPKYLLLIFEVIFSRKINDVSYIYNKVSKYRYEEIEGFLVKDQLNQLIELFEVS